MSRIPFIGKRITIIDSKNKFDVGSEGKVIDESQNTIIIETVKGEKKFWKNNIVFGINNLVIYGNKINRRITGRIKI